MRSNRPPARHDTDRIASIKWIWRIRQCRPTIESSEGSPRIAFGVTSTEVVHCAPSIALNARPNIRQSSRLWRGNEVLSLRVMISREHVCGATRGVAQAPICTDKWIGVTDICRPNSGIESCDAYSFSGIESIEGLALSRNLLRTMSIYERFTSLSRLSALRWILTNEFAVSGRYFRSARGCADGKAKRVRPEQCKQLKASWIQLFENCRRSPSETIGAVWEELCFALAPASWNHPAPPKTHRKYFSWN
jgi:hypothetical protein